VPNTTFVVREDSALAVLTPVQVDARSGVFEFVYYALDLGGEVCETVDYHCVAHTRGRFHRSDESTSNGHSNAMSSLRNTNTTASNSVRMAAIACKMPVAIPSGNGPNAKEKIGNLQHKRLPGVVKFSAGIVKPAPSTGRVMTGAERQGI
jgi:hypothetical protein